MAASFRYYCSSPPPRSLEGMSSCSSEEVVLDRRAASVPRARTSGFVYTADDSSLWSENFYSPQKCPPSPTCSASHGAAERTSTRVTDQHREEEQGHQKPELDTQDKTPDALPSFPVIVPPFWHTRQPPAAPAPTPAPSGTLGALSAQLKLNMPSPIRPPSTPAGMSTCRALHTPVHRQRTPTPSSSGESMMYSFNPYADWWLHGWSPCPHPGAPATTAMQQDPRLGYDSGMGCADRLDDLDALICQGHL